jgi:putative FmdB family regulatory protein
MPLYEYQCENCGDVFELIQKFSDTPLATHEKCGGPVHRLISRSALQFKGSGFYITDYAKSGSSAGNGGKKDGDTSGGKEGASASADSKESKSGDKSSDTSKTTTTSTPATTTPAASSDKK